MVRPFAVAVVAAELPVAHCPDGLALVVAVAGLAAQRVATSPDDRARYQDCAVAPSPLAVLAVPVAKAAVPALVAPPLEVVFAVPVAMGE